MSKDYSKGYAIGYIKAIRNVMNWLDNTEGGLRLISFVGWLQDQEATHMEHLDALSRDIPESPKVRKQDGTLSNKSKKGE